MQYQMTRCASSASHEMICAQSNSEFLVQTVKNLVGLLEYESALFIFFWWYRCLSVSNTIKYPVVIVSHLTAGGKTFYNF